MFLIVCYPTYLWRPIDPARATDAWHASHSQSEPPPLVGQMNATFCSIARPQLFCPDLWAVTAPELAGGEGKRRRSPRRDPVPGR